MRRSWSRGLFGSPARSLAMAALTSTTLLTGCSATGQPSDAGLSVVAAFYPYAFVAERVVGPYASVTNLTRQDSSRTTSSSPRGRSAASSRPTLWSSNGASSPRSTTRSTRTPRARPSTSPRRPPRGHRRSRHRRGGQCEVVLSGDPHIWLDPTRLAAVTRRSPARWDRSTRFTPPPTAATPPPSSPNSAGWTVLTDRAGDCARTRVRHQPRRLRLPGAALRSADDRHQRTDADAEPSPERLGQLQDLVRRDGITTVFSEVLASQQIAETLADDLGVGTAVLDPIEGLPQSELVEDYFSLMRSNLAALEKANGCS